MARPDTHSTDPRMVAPDQLCATCGAPLAADQRYCLNCGRRLERREDLWRALAPPPPPTAPAVPVAPVPGPGGAFTPLLGLTLAGLLLLAGFGGYLVARDGSPEAPRIDVAAAPQPNVNVTVPVTAAGGGGATPEEVTAADWGGEDGWTIALATLPKDGTDQAAVDQAKAAAEADGAKGVGVLDSDEFPSLDPGEFVVFSGVFATKKSASAALAKLKKDYPDASVVKVSATDAGGAAPKVDKDAQTQSKDDLKDLQDAKGDDYVKQSKKLKDKVGTQGAVPKKDDKKPGGGSGDGTVLE